MNEIFNLKHNFPLEENIIDTLGKHIDQLSFPHNLKVIKNNKAEYSLEPDDKKLELLISV